MDDSFPRYLLAKQSVDDRALNRQVLDALKLRLPVRDLRVIEVGAGMGSMLARLLSWQVVRCAEYIHVDAAEENIRFAAEWLPQWAAQAGMCVESLEQDRLRIFDGLREVCVTLVHADVFDFIDTEPAPGDLLIAHAFLDLLPMPEALPRLLGLTKDLAWLTVNFDGVTSLEPPLDSILDERIERLYHATMDRRLTGGDSRSGRHLFQYLRAAGANVLAAGPSDWVVYAQGGHYPAQEAYFLHYILRFFEEALTGDLGLDAAAFQHWLAERRSQVDRGELVYIAHQLDFLASRSSNPS